ncbi:hypothetical protein SFSGTM_23220 [Sulfuriferula nivalis]|uniref:Uncharacterized protein n=1 Tax=Sulfuriferula nivalis TaxID=2675298 RepID=A0A809RLD6_9PROT|nr:hypothetical protein SFSGTM_23220 [Sulfuriferula nivalis]
MIALAHAYKAGATLAVIEFAVAWAQVALNTTIGYSMPVFSRMMWIHLINPASLHLLTV